MEILFASIAMKGHHLNHECKKEDFILKSKKDLKHLDFHGGYINTTGTVYHVGSFANSCGVWAHLNFCDAVGLDEKEVEKTWIKVWTSMSSGKTEFIFPMTEDFEFVKITKEQEKAVLDICKALKLDIPDELTE
jgi:hypothetical protein